MLCGPRSPWHTVSESPHRGVPAIASWKRRIKSPAAASCSSTEVVGDLVRHRPLDVGEQVVPVVGTTQPPRRPLEADPLEVLEQLGHISRPVVGGDPYDITEPDDPSPHVSEPIYLIVLFDVSAGGLTSRSGIPVYWSRMAVIRCLARMVSENGPSPIACCIRPLVTITPRSAPFHR